MIKSLRALLLLTLFAACTNNAGNSGAQEDSSVTGTQTETTGDSQQTDDVTTALSRQLSTAFPLLFRYFKEQDNRFSPEKFEEAGTSPVDTSRALPVEEEQLAPYYPYMLYNSDSTYAIDLYSYNYVISSHNNKTVVEEGGPDTEVAIIDLKNKTRKRVFFSGTPTTVFDAAWINNSSFFLATGEMVTGDRTDAYGVQPDILLYDIPLRLVKHFIYTDTLQVKKGSGYRDSRLPGEQNPGSGEL